MFRLVLIFAAASLPSMLLADGGAVLLHQEIPPLAITLFASPTPPRAGMIDLSVLLQTVETLDSVLDADVQLTLVQGSDRIQTRATHDQTQNKILYGATVRLGNPGDWRYTVTVRTAGSVASVSATGVISVAAAEPKWTAYAGYLALPFVCLAIFALHQWLRWGKRGT